jgi:hypothetical protein
MVHGLQQILEMNENACRIHEAKNLGIVDPGRRLEYAESAARNAKEYKGWNDERIQQELDKRRAAAPLPHERFRQQRKEAFRGKGRQRFVAEETTRELQRRLGRTDQGGVPSPYGGEDRGYAGSSRVGRFKEDSGLTVVEFDELGRRQVSNDPDILE